MSTAGPARRSVGLTTPAARATIDEFETHCQRGALGAWAGSCLAGVATLTRGFCGTLGRSEVSENSTTPATLAAIAASALPARNMGLRRRGITSSSSSIAL